MKNHEAHFTPALTIPESDIAAFVKGLDAVLTHGEAIGEQIDIWHCY